MSSNLQSADVSAPKRIASVIAAFRQRMLIPAQIAVNRAVRTFAPLGTLRSAVPTLIGLTLLSSASFAQTTPPTVTPPALGTAGVNCVISAANRNAVVEIDGGYSIFNIPANAGAFRGRVTWQAHFVAA